MHMSLQKKLIILLLTLAALLPLLDLLHSGFPITHDGQDHVARIANFYLSLSEGNVIPRWAGNLNWGYGHPILMFLYPFPSYLASLFHAVGFSFVDSTKLVFAVAYVVSILVMYGWASAQWGLLAGVTAAMLYGFAPYRFVDLYVRGAIGEHMAFVFLPVVLWGVYTLKKHKASVWALCTVSFGTASLILSHNALSLMFIPIIALYALYLAFDHETYPYRFLALCGALVGTGFLLAAFFWVPALLEGKYTLRDIVTAGEFDGRFVPWTWFIYSPWNYGGGNDFTKSLGWSQLLTTATYLLCMFRLKRFRTTLLGIGALIILCISVFLMTPVSHSIWQHVTLMQKFQFPWRLLSVSIFALAVIGAVAISQMSGAMKRVCAGILIALSVITTMPMWHANIYKTFKPNFFSDVYHGTTDTGESSPIWSIRFMEHEASASMELIKGDAVIRSMSRTTTKHSYAVVAKSQSRIVENTLYFPGWNIYVDNMPVAIEFQDPLHRGLMTFEVPPGVHSIDVRFTDTKLRKLSNAISAVSLVLFMLVLGTMPIWRRKK
jgi:hypothetical protein